MAPTRCHHCCPPSPSAGHQCKSKINIGRAWRAEVTVYLEEPTRTSLNKYPPKQIQLPRGKRDVQVAYLFSSTSTGALHHEDGHRPCSAVQKQTPRWTAASGWGSNEIATANTQRAFQPKSDSIGAAFKCAVPISCSVSSCDILSG